MPPVNVERHLAARVRLPGAGGAAAGAQFYLTSLRRAPPSGVLQGLGLELWVPQAEPGPELGAGFPS